MSQMLDESGNERLHGSPSDRQGAAIADAPGVDPCGALACGEPLWFFRGNGLILAPIEAIAC